MICDAKQNQGCAALVKNPGIKKPLSGV